MGPPPRNAERRAERREQRALSCELIFRGRRHTGVVLDLSRQGLFLRTHFAAEPGSRVAVRIRRPGGVLWELEARVTRCDRNARGDALISGRGLGLAILKAPQAFEDFVDELAE
jgi:hypothetical protein